jgi:hypothetical protein
MQRFHVWLGEKRTTVTLDSPLPELLALSLSEEPNTSAATRAIARWLQERLDEHDDPGRARVSQWLRGQAVFHLLDTKIANRYNEWLDKQIL